MMWHHFIEWIKHVEQAYVHLTKIVDGGVADVNET